MERECTVAIVDDDPSIRRFMAQVLTRAGYLTIEASNAVEAKDLIQKRVAPIALLISDIRMPGGNGLDLALDVEALQPATPVLYISGLIDSVAVQSIILKNPLAILTKPFSARKFVERVVGLIGPAPAPHSGGEDRTASTDACRSDQRQPTRAFRGMREAG